MRTRAWAAAAAAGLLVAGVVVVRSGTAVDEADVRAASAPTTTAPEAATDGSLLAVDGLPGLRLGDPGEGLGSVLDMDLGRGPLLRVGDLPGGCDVARDPAAPRTGARWGALAWVADDEVSAVLVSAVDGAVGTAGRTSGGAAGAPGRLRTWLGPTLGSRVTAVEELAGATTRVHRPFGEDGPSVTVVEVPADGVETVWSDVGSPGRVSTVEVRHPRARRCSVEALQARLDELDGRGSATTAPVLLGSAGLTAVPLGLPVTELVELPGVQRQPGDPVGRCSSYWYVDAAGRRTTVQVADAVVVAVEPAGPVTTTFGVSTGDEPGDVLDELPELAGRTPAQLSRGPTEVERDGSVLTLLFAHDTRWVPEVEPPVDDGPLVLRGVAVRTAEASLSC